MIIAGEASGDLHGGRLVQALLHENPTLDIFGVGGDHMAAAGMKLYYHINQLAYIGFIEVVRHYFFFRKVFLHLLKVLESRRPDVVVFIDYPGFNLRFARAAKKLGFTTVYYIAPQVWAWGQSRAKKMSKYIDAMAVLFNFEVDFFSRHGIETHFVGHPLVESVQRPKERKTFYHELGFQMDKPLLAILPGSRKQEVNLLMPSIKETIKILHLRHPDLQFAISKAQTIPIELLTKYLPEFPTVKIIETDLHALMAHATAGIVASGTATLEAALFRLPFIIVYRVAHISYLLAKHLIKIPYIGLVNVVAGEPIIKEFIQNDLKPEKIATELEQIIFNETYRKNIIDKLGCIKPAIGEKGASEKTAQLILGMLPSNRK